MCLSYLSAMPRPSLTVVWRDVRRKNLWSFQLYEGNWVSPTLVNAGTATVTQGLNTVTFDASVGSPAVAALAALPGPFPTPLLQRRFPGRQLHNL